jgi:hypothetical protein
LPFNDSPIEIQLQDACRCSSFGRERLDHSASKREVILPTVASWMEEIHEAACMCIKRADITPLPHVASKTAIGEIVGIRSTAMFAADDVID